MVVLTGLTVKVGLDEENEGSAIFLGRNDLLRILGSEFATNRCEF